jgi:hypothetical protein
VKSLFQFFSFILPVGLAIRLARSSMKPVDVRKNQIRSILFIVLTALVGSLVIRTDLIILAEEALRRVFSVVHHLESPEVATIATVPTIQSGGSFSVGTPVFGGGGGLSSGGSFTVSGNLGQPVTGSSVGGGFSSGGGTFSGQNPACVPLLIDQTTLESGKVGQPYNQQLTQSLGTAPLIWSIVSGALPAGLSLNSTSGLISGIPRAGGTFTLLVSIADSNTCTGEQAFNLVINSVNPGPGQPLSYLDGQFAGQMAGSVLIYNIYTSAVATDRQETRITLTNVNPQISSYVHLFFVDGRDCSVADSFVCLTPNQTVSFLAGDLDPETTGYLVAVATDASGCPVNFNFLIGGALVKFQSGHAANLPAQSAMALTGWSTICGAEANEAVLRFDGQRYSLLPRALAVTSLAARANGNETLLIINRLGGDLGTGGDPPGNLYGLLFNDLEEGVSFSIPAAGCQLQMILSGSVLRTTPRIERYIPAGRTGWMKFWTAEEKGIAGAVINRADAIGGYNQGHNLHILTTTDKVVYKIPVFPPSC